MDTPSLRPIKKAKCEEATSDNCFRDVQRLLMGQKPPFVRYKIRNNLSLARKYFDEQGFRTSIIQSPRKGLSIYRDSCVLQNDGGNLADKAFLVTMLGLHPRQEEMDLYYTTSIRQPYCVLLLCERIRKVCQKCLDGKCGLALALKRCEENSRAFGAMDLPGENSVKDVHSLSSKLEQSVAQLMQCVIAADPVIRLDQLHREFEHIQCCNSTLANAHFQLWATENCTCIKEIYWKRSHLQKLERFTIYFYDPESDEKKPVPFRWMPCLSQVVREDLESVAKSMTEMFWSQLLKRGYFASQVMKIGLSEELEKYFLFGISRNPSVPLLLNAHFVPTYQLSFYLHGRAGVGKSSLVRLFSSVMNQVVKEFTDPEMIVRFVKQNLNKAYNVLELELELRPNNNDLSVMSIIQGRRMTMGQTKPGLVVVGLEEMPRNKPGADPNQLETAQLISQRFSGRKGSYREKNSPRDLGATGISNDASIIPLFTANYPLEDSSYRALVHLKMFANLGVIEVKALDGDERKHFSIAYLQQMIQDYFPGFNADSSQVHVELPSIDGDMRPLVKLLRMVVFYIRHCFEKSAVVSSSISVLLSYDKSKIIVGKQQIDLDMTSSENLVLCPPQTFNERARVVMDELKSSGDVPCAELSLVLDLWLAGTLAPAVIVSNTREKINFLLAALKQLKEVKKILGIDAAQFKMVKSLYDPSNTPNLRDKILQYGRGVHVAVELLCDSVDSQMRIREIIEDTPSMTAFSTENSALDKTGLLFCVVVKGHLTPEIKSRASLVWA